MLFKIVFLFSVILVCQGTIPEQYTNRIPLRFLLNNQGMRRPGAEWIYQIVNGRPVVSGFANPNSYVALGLNPQTGQIEQTQVITQTRPGGPVISMIQNMMQVAGQFIGQLSGALGNVVGGALQTAGQFGQDIKDISNPVTSITGITHPVIVPIKQTTQQNSETTIRPPSTQSGPSIEVPPRPAREIPSLPVDPPSIQIPSLPVNPTSIQVPSLPVNPTSIQVPSLPVNPSSIQVPSLPVNPLPIQTSSLPSVVNIPEQPKLDVEMAEQTIEQTLVSIETFQTAIKSHFKTYFESEEGETVLSKINENINSVVDELKNLREMAVTDSISALQAGQNAVSLAFDNIEKALADIVGSQGKEFIEPAIIEINKSFNEALQFYNTAISGIKETIKYEPEDK